MLHPDVSRACAALKNALNLPPGPELDRLIQAAESAQSLKDLPKWVKDGLRQINWPGDY